MGNGIESIESSLGGLRLQYQAVTNNLANANTVGYKRRIGAFHEVMGSQMNSGEGNFSVAKNAPTSFAVGSSNSPLGGNSPTSINALVSIDFTSGNLKQTGRPLDIAIEGEGFFTVETPQGNRYSRNGVFRVNPRGQLVDSRGRTIAGEGGPVIVPSEISVADIHFQTNGSISAGGKAIGKLKVVEFENPSVLKPIGDGLFIAPPSATPTAAKNTSVMQGYQEASNVNVTEELVKMIALTRLYEANLKSLNQHDGSIRGLLQVAMA